MKEGDIKEEKRKRKSEKKEKHTPKDEIGVNIERQGSRWKNMKLKG